MFLPSEELLGLRSCAKNREKKRDDVIEAAGCIVRDQQIIDARLSCNELSGCAGNARDG